MKTYKSIERKSMILGMPVQDLLLLMALLIGLVLLGGVMGTFMPVSKYYYLLSLCLVLLLLLLLRSLGRRKHPTFLSSVISYYFLQARRISLNPDDHENPTPSHAGRKGFRQDPSIFPSDAGVCDGRPQTPA
ncbi:hypothetical protein [Nafulsella turpanensis]|uniref:hypothetical protein n=1 Tax=Nafulsella turpanensis TaxID=1265690 RepID=UPI00034AEA5C|nr:hypothetical protein [Nafulsella turpanensis]